MQRQFEIYQLGLAGKKLSVPIPVAQLENKAAEVLPPQAYDYVAGSASGERSARANLAAFDRWRIVPRMLRDVSQRDLTVALFGHTLPAPVLLGPIGVQNIIHPDAEVAVARAAASLGVPFVLRTVSSRPLEEVAHAMAAAPRWFQLYWGKDHELTASLAAARGKVRLHRARRHSRHRHARMARTRSPASLPSIPSWPRTRELLHRSCLLLASPAVAASRSRVRHSPLGNSVLEHRPPLERSRLAPPANSFAHSAERNPAPRRRPAGPRPRRRRHHRLQPRRPPGRRSHRRTRRAPRRRRCNPTENAHPLRQWHSLRRRRHQGSGPRRSRRAAGTSLCLGSRHRRRARRPRRSAKFPGRPGPDDGPKWLPLRAGTGRIDPDERKMSLAGKTCSRGAAKDCSPQLALSLPKGRRPWVRPNEIVSNPRKGRKKNQVVWPYYPLCPPPNLTSAATIFPDHCVTSSSRSVLSAD